MDINREEKKTISPEYIGSMVVPGDDKRGGVGRDGIREKSIAQ